MRALLYLQSASHQKWSNSGVILKSGISRNGVCVYLSSLEPWLHLGTTDSYSRGISLAQEEVISNASARNVTTRSKTGEAQSFCMIESWWNYVYGAIRERISRRKRERKREEHLHNNNSFLGRRATSQLDPTLKPNDTHHPSLVIRRLVSPRHTESSCEKEAQSRKLPEFPGGAITRARGEQNRRALMIYQSITKYGAARGKLLAQQRRTLIILLLITLAREIDLA